MPSHWYGILAAVFSVGAQFVLFLRWMHRRMRNDEIMRAFVRDTATNHLPHIYDALRNVLLEAADKAGNLLSAFTAADTHRHHHPAVAAELKTVVILRRTREVRRRISTDEISSDSCLVLIMLSKLWPKLIAASFALIFCIFIVEAWRADRRDRAKLAVELASTNQLLAAADARQHDRDAQLAQTLSALDAQKRAILTPAQVVRALLKTLPLSEPITVHPPPRPQMPSVRPWGRRALHQQTPPQQQPLQPLPSRTKSLRPVR